MTIALSMADRKNGSAQRGSNIARGLLDMNSTEVSDLSSLRTLVYGAAPIAPAAVGRLVKQFGSMLTKPGRGTSFMAGLRCTGWV
jgi:fatty-acyl-CoA synthase